MEKSQLILRQPRRDRCISQSKATTEDARELDPPLVAHTILLPSKTRQKMKIHRSKRTAEPTFSPTQLVIRGVPSLQKTQSRAECTLWLQTYQQADHTAHDEVTAVASCSFLSRHLAAFTPRGYPPFVWE